MKFGVVGAVGLGGAVCVWVVWDGCRVEVCWEKKGKEGIGSANVHRERV